MATKDDVRAFLLEMKMALSHDKWRFVDRDKNLAALAGLEMLHSDVPKVLRSLALEDYSEGPLSDDKGRDRSWWVFGRQHGDVILYIKICIDHGFVECLSFHPAEYPIDCPFRREGRAC